MFSRDIALGICANIHYTTQQELFFGYYYYQSSRSCMHLVFLVSYVCASIRENDSDYASQA